MHSFSELVVSFEQWFAANLPFPQSPDTLYDPCRYLLEEGGKRIRPVLCLMGNELFGEITPDAWHAAAGIELFHNFTLIHDDIMDKAPLRRGKPTIHARYGLTTGILSGDVMSIYSNDQVARVKTNLSQTLRLFNQTAIEVCEGQQLDMDFEARNDVSMEEYLHMITLKTSVLLACSLKMGALVGGSLGDNADKLYEFGKNMGVAFQLMDDYLDAFGDGAKTGKMVGGDIMANKKTFLLVHALKNCNAEQATAFRELMRREDEGKIAAVLALYRETGSDRACHDEVNRYSEKAFAALAAVAIPSGRKEPLYQLASALLQRER
jgi:geranylgeranyl diphosphate synthase, type II